MQDSCVSISRSKKFIPTKNSVGASLVSFHTNGHRLSAWSVFVDLKLLLASQLEPIDERKRIEQFYKACLLEPHQVLSSAKTCQSAHHYFPYCHLLMRLMRLHNCVDPTIVHAIPFCGLHFKKTRRQPEHNSYHLFTWKYISHTAIKNNSIQFN